MEKSQSIKEIAKALMLFQTKMDKIKKDATNPFYKSKYASLSTILENIQLPLAESGLTFSQLPDGDCLTTILVHSESGEYFQACYNIHPVKSDPQAIGSAITYARRYALSAILGLNVDEDDDANAATKPEVNTEKKEQAKPEGKFPEDNRPWLTDKLLDAAISRILQGETDVAEKTIKAYKMKKEYKSQINSAVETASR